LLVFFGLFCTRTYAQIKFIQITDPHLYDGRKGVIGDDETKSIAVLADCIETINGLKKHGPDYRFVVVTGDLGIERVVKDILDAKRQKIDTKTKEVNDEVNGKVNEKAKQLAESVVKSEVKTWLFIPGNNDLVDELPNTIGYYHLFIAELKKKCKELNQDMEIVDLCPPDESPSNGADSKSISYVAGDYTFVGFNDSSFKNNNESSRLSNNQIKYVDDVKRVLSNSGPFVYVFFHVPEIDDPYLASGAPDDKLVETINTRLSNAQTTGIGYAYSA